MIRAYITWKTKIVCDLLLLLCRKISTNAVLHSRYNIKYMKLLSSVTKIIKKKNIFDVLTYYIADSQKRTNYYRVL